MPSQMDQDVINLAKSIRRVESNDNFEAKGKSGEHGAYQWMPDTWKGHAKDVLGDENAPMTRENQNAVAYVTLKKLKDKGLNPAQIAAKWNSGSENNWENKIGVNSKGVEYNVPLYVKRVTDTYHEIKGQSSPQPQATGNYQTQPSLPQGTGVPQQEKDKGLVGNIASDASKRIGDVAKSISDIPAALTGKGKQNVVSDVLQTGGAIGGLIGDVTNRVIEKTPFLGDAVKKIENLIGQGVGALAATPAGQEVAKSITEWSKKHPELAADVGAGFNIATAIPILKGLGALKNVTLDATAQALKGVAEKGAIKDLTSTAMRTKSGERALARNPGAIKTLVDERALPDIENGKYTIQEANSRLEHAISEIEEKELQPALERGNVKEVSSRIPLEQLKKEAVQEAIDSLKEPGPVEKYFDRLKSKYGDYLTIQQVNEAKRVVAKNISEAGFNSPTLTTDKLVRQILQKGVEDGAKALGLEDVAAINQKMVRLFKAQDMLDVLDRKPVKLGKFGGILQDTAMTGGELAGNSTGIPLAGAFIGRELGGRTARSIVGFRTGLLNRTGKNASRKPLKTSAREAAKGLIGAEAQKSTKDQ